MSEIQKKNTISHQLFSKMGANVWCAKQTRLGDHLSFQGIWKWCGWKWWLCKGHFIKESREMGHLVYRSLGMWFFSVESAFFWRGRVKVQFENVATPGFFTSILDSGFEAGNIWWQTIMSYNFFQRIKVLQKKNGSAETAGVDSFREGIFHRESAGFLQLLVFKKSKLAKSLGKNNLQKESQVRLMLANQTQPNPGCMLGTKHPRQPCWLDYPWHSWYWGERWTGHSDDVFSY